jgi:cell fate regulator YaaT (PSP1 superfamily)
MPLELELLPPEERLTEPALPKTLLVRYGYLREIGEFPSDLTQKAPCGAKLVVRTDRGTEIAELLGTTCAGTPCPKTITREQLLAYIDKSGSRNYPFTEQGHVLRVATPQDLLEQSKLDENRNRDLTMARDLVRTHKLAMKIVEVEHLLGGERILFYFVSEHRVDFRLLVRDLAHSLHTRIELRQVGARDEARLAADFEKCGQHCCCRQFLKALTPISMRAAKIQKATLDPTKISGRCGRLMCCLRYEDKTYDELRKKLPKRNTRVATEKGDAWVIDGQILTQLVLCQYDDGTREAIPLEKITAFDRPKPVLPDGRIMQTPNDRPPMMAGDQGQRRNGAGPNGPPAPQRRPRPGAPAAAPAGEAPVAAGPAGGDMVDERALSALDDGFDDLLADAMEEAPDGEAPADSGTPAADSAPRVPQPQPARPPEVGNGPRPNQPQRQNRPPQQQPPKGPRPPQNQQQRGRGNPQGQRPPQPQRNQPFRPPQPQQNQQNQPRPAQAPGQASPSSATSAPVQPPPPAPESSPVAQADVTPAPPSVAPSVPPPSEAAGGGAVPPADSQA